MKINFNEFILEKNVDNFPFNETEFSEFIDSILDDMDSDDNGELLEEIYIELPDIYKKIYQDKILKYRIYIPVSNNISLIKDIIKNNYDELEKETLLYNDDFIYIIDNYSEFYTENFSEHYSIEFIKNIDEILQGRIIQRCVEKLKEGTIEIDEDMFNCFYKNVQLLIKKYEIKASNGITGIIPEVFILK